MPRSRSPFRSPLAVVLAVAVAGLAAAPAPAAHRRGATGRTATVDLTAFRIRVGDHPAYVRVVVDFTDGVLNAPAIEATDPDPYPDGKVRIVVPSRNAQAQAPTVRAQRLTARVLPGHDRVVATVSAAVRRFKYAAYQVLHDGERLVIDLYKSRPPAAGASAVYGRPGCLRFTSISTTVGRVAVAGTERNVFEHSFPVHVRSSAGRVLGRRVVTATNGRWHARVPYRVARAQTGTVEAVELSAKDGALACLVQAPVRLRR
jgi:Immunoglobulin-like domain of bacterial spore germination